MDRSWLRLLRRSYCPTLVNYFLIGRVCRHPPSKKCTSGSSNNYSVQLLLVEHLSLTGFSVTPLKTKTDQSRVGNKRYIYITETRRQKNWHSSFLISFTMVSRSHDTKTTTTITSTTSKNLNITIIKSVCSSLWWKIMMR